MTGRANVMAQCRKPSLFLFPHQDDEFGVFALLESNVRAGTRSVCVFLTDGAGNGVLPSRRDSESARVLRDIGVLPEDVLFLPDAERAGDGHLVERMDSVLASLIRIAETHDIGAIYSPSWEGGHPDHDAAALIAMGLADHLDCCKLWYFSLYSSYRVKFLPFCVLRPIRRGFESQKFHVSRRSALRYLRFCLNYPSQWKTWTALLPFVGWHLLRHASQEIHALTPICFCQRPHDGPLLYEQRGWTTWDDFRMRSRPFIEKQLNLDCAVEPDQPLDAGPISVVSNDDSAANPAER